MINLLAPNFATVPILNLECIGNFTHLTMSSNSEVKKEHSFTWKIEDFRFCSKTKGEFFKSPVFTAKSLYETSWFLRLYPRGDKESNEGYVGCFLNRSENDGSSKIECDFEISIMAADGKMLQSNKTSHIFRKSDFFGWSDFWKKSIQYEDTNDVLLIRCVLKSNAPKSPWRSESSGVTSFDFDQRSCKFIVRNLNSNCSEKHTIQYTFALKLEIHVCVLNDDVKITIIRGERDFKAKFVMCQICLLDVEGRQQLSRQDFHFFGSEESFTEDGTWEFPTFLLKSKLNSEREKYLENDCFTLKFKIAISNGDQTDTVEDKKSVIHLHPDIAATAILEDYRRLYKDKINTDVKLLVDGQIIQAHKGILSIRSPVFMAMFNTDMVENETGTVNIPDLDTKTANFLLEYMYAGIVEKLDYEVAAKLIVAADKYQILNLKEICANFLKSTLSVENACHVLVVADLIQHEILKDGCIRYIKDNAEFIFLSEEWKSIVEKNLHLATDTFWKVSKFTATNRNKPENK